MQVFDDRSHVLGNLPAHHQDFSTVHSALLSFIQVFDDRFYVLGNISAQHQEFSTVHSALVSFMQVFDDRFQAESGWNCSSILNLLGNGHQKPA